MAQQISVEITANGKPLSPFSALSLRQQINGHHYFEIRMNHDVLETLGTLHLDQSKNLLGKPLNIAFNNLSKTGTENTFKGIVTDIRISNSLHSPGDLIVSGYSTTILLENGETNASYLNVPLSQIVSKTAAGASGLTVKANPAKKSSLPYVVQYRESNFAFLRRLAAEYGEHFYYDGIALAFGKPSGAPTVELKYPNDISNLSLQMRLAPVTFEQLSHLSKEDKVVNASSGSEEVSGLDAYGKFALSASASAFSVKSSTLSKRKFLDQKEMNEAVKTAKSTRAADLVVLQATTDAPSVKVGATIHVTALDKDYGKFLVTSVHHHTDGMGNYHNEVEGVPAMLAVLPNPHYHKPIAEAQIGIVADNKDPDNRGRVKVKLHWQKDNQTTPFVRVLTPNGGSNGKKITRGHFFTPEVGDHVMVGFAQNDPDRPFVIGALQHGKAINSSPNNDNHYKSISTRSGNLIHFLDKDKEKEQEIHIETTDKNFITINVKNGDGTIKIFSSKAIEVNSKETIVVKSGKSIDVQGDKTIHVKSENITIEATDSIVMKANKKIEMKAMDVQIEGSKGFEAKGGANAKLEGAQTEVSGSVSAKVKGAMLDLEGSAMANLKAAIVKIN